MSYDLYARMAEEKLRAMNYETIYGKRGKTLTMVLERIVFDIPINTFISMETPGSLSSVHYSPTEGWYMLGGIWYFFGDPEHDTTITVYLNDMTVEDVHEIDIRGFNRFDKNPLALPENGIYEIKFIEPKEMIVKISYKTYTLGEKQRKATGIYIQPK